MKTHRGRLLLIVVIVAGTLAAGGWALHQSGSAPDGPSNDDEATSVVCLGFVDLEHGLRLLTPLQPGRVDEILVKEGAHVEAGTPLLRLDDAAVRLQLKAAQSAADAAQAAVEQSRILPRQHEAKRKQQHAAIDAVVARLSGARTALRQQEDLAQGRLVNDRAVAIAREQVRELEAQELAERQKLVELELIDPETAVRQAEAELGVAIARREQAHHALKDCTLTAPTAGVVQRVMVGRGDVISGRPAVQFCPDEPRLIRAEVSQEFADRVRVGQSAVIRDDARPRLQWRGRVSRVSDWYGQRRPNPQDPSAFLDVRTVEFLLSIEPGSEPLRIGQRVRVVFDR
jgi:multidrug resistance efflux pump